MYESFKKKKQKEGIVYIMFIKGRQTNECKRVDIYWICLSRDWKRKDFSLALMNRISQFAKKEISTILILLFFSKISEIQIPIGAGMTLESVQSINTARKNFIQNKEEKTKGKRKGAVMTGLGRGNEKGEKNMKIEVEEEGTRRRKSKK